MYPYPSYPPYQVPPMSAPMYRSSSPLLYAPMRSISPLHLPKGGGMVKSLFPAIKAGSKGTLSKVLTGTENVIATINQAIPIYQQVKPLWENTKGIRKALKKVVPFSFTRSSNKENKEVITDPEIITPKKETKEEKKTSYDTYEEQNEPNQPFF